MQTVQESSQRTRYVFILINIAGLILFSSWFNYNFSYLRYSLFAEEFYNVCQKPQLGLEKTKPNSLDSTQKAECEKVSARDSSLSMNPNDKDKIENYHNDMHDIRLMRAGIVEKDFGLLMIPILGLKIHIWDSALIGSISMTILIIWFYFSIKRENLVIKETYEISKNIKDKEVISYINTIISHKFVFNFNSTNRDENHIFSLENIIRLATVSLLYIPSWMPLFITITQIILYSLPMDSPWVVASPTVQTTWENYGSEAQIDFTVRSIIIALISFFNINICWSIRNFQIENNSKLKALSNLSINS